MTSIRVMYLCYWPALVVTCHKGLFTALMRPSACEFCAILNEVPTECSPDCWWPVFLFAFVCLFYLPVLRRMDAMRQINQLVANDFCFLRKIIWVIYSLLSLKLWSSGIAEWIHFYTVLYTTKNIGIKSNVTFCVKFDEFQWVISIGGVSYGARGG